MTEEFRRLTDRLGWVYATDGGDRIGAGRLLTSSNEIRLELPVDEEIAPRLGLQSGFAIGREIDVPTRLVFVDQHGPVGLDKCRYRNSVHNPALTDSVTVVADAAVEIGDRSHDFWSVNGVRTELAGLAAWTRLASTTYETVNDGNGLLQSVEAKASSQPTVEIGGTCGLSFKPHFSVNGSHTNGEFLIRERVYAQTSFDDAASWEQHLRIHQNVQDLLTVAFGRGCGLQVAEWSSSEYPITRPRTGEPIGDKWRQVVVRWNGRGAPDGIKLPDRSRMLFSFDDIGSSGVRRWIDESDTWINVVGPLSATRFQSGLPVELAILQVGIAVEALGYRIAVRQGLISEGGQQSFPKYMQRISETIDCGLEVILAGSPDNGVPAFASFDEWSAAFNDVYKQSKHADHPLPDPIRGWVMAEAGALLVRMWLAREFGCPRDRIETNAQFL